MHASIAAIEYHLPDAVLTSAELAGFYPDWSVEKIESPTGIKTMHIGLEGPDDPRNLALVCARCNHGKGKGPDLDGPGSARAREVVGSLLVRRLARFRPLGDA